MKVKQHFNPLTLMFFSEMRNWVYVSVYLGFTQVSHWVELHSYLSHKEFTLPEINSTN